ncbi:aminopeptidase N [Arhodomonas sp. SL1]|uniref:aminopeptidase N n=1 Tax=Arhodomonas sp. SL1 TaxID=3425691 RepID=UPI003F88391F
MADRPPLHRRDAYTPPPFLVDRAFLCFELDLAQTRVHSRLCLRRNPDAPVRAGLHLDGQDLTLEAVALDGEPLACGRYRYQGDGLEIHGAPERCELETRVVLQPQANTALMGLYAAGGMLCTQCEPEAFRRITFFPDRPDVLAVFRTELIGDPRRFPVMLANGNPGQREVLPDGRHRVVWEDPFPKPAYLFALVAGELEAVSAEHVTGSGRRVPLRLYVEPGNGGRGGHALDALRRAMAWEEARYGLEYDLEVLDLVAVSRYTMGAMENKGLLVFNDRYLLADPATATDRDYRDIEALVAHEYLHNWSGNRVTGRDWFQLALKEGFTVFREQQFVTEQGWGGARRLEDMQVLRRRQFPEDAGPLRHPVRPAAYREIENFYTDTVYAKGAEIVRMLALCLGEARFRSGTDRYFRDHDGTAVTVEDFLAALSAATGEPLAGFLAWYDEAGTPELACRGRFDAGKGVYTLEVRQSPPAGGAPRPLPLAIGLRDADGAPLPVCLGPGQEGADTRVLPITESVQEFHCHGLDSAPVPVLLRGFSAPVRLDFPYTPDELVTLAIHEDDACVRWDAVQRLVVAAVSEPGGPRGQAPALTALAEAFAGILERADAAPLVAAELLTLPDAGALVRESTLDDVAAADAALAAVARHVVERSGAALEAVYEACGATAPGPPDPQRAGRRALRNACLARLWHGGRAGAFERCLEQFRWATNMTDRLAALGLLAHHEGDTVAALLAAFRERWAGEPLVLDQWFAIQARSRRADTLERVRALCADPAFSLEAPNRVRALVASFATGNPLRFHAADGAGYRFLADRVLALDALNPPLAAELLRPLTEGHWHEAGRRARMRAELERVGAAPDLSGGCAEIVTLALKEGEG